MQNHLETSSSVGARSASARLATVLLTLSCLALGVLGCGGTQDGSQGDRETVAAESSEIAVAVAWPWAARGELLFAQGLDLALEEINAAGGVSGRPLKVIRVDDQESVNEGRLAAQRLADNPEVMAVIGHLQSHVTVPASAIYDAAGLVLLSPASTSADLTEQGYSRVFRGCFVDRDVGSQMAEYAKSKGYERVAIYYIRSIYGRALASAFEQRVGEIGGVNVVARDAHGADQDFGSGTLQPLLSRWSQLDIDAIFLAGEVPSAGRIIAELGRSDLDVPVFGGDAMSSPALIQEGGEATEGTVVATFFHPGEPRPEVKAFVEAFKTRFDQKPDVAAALAYDSLRLLAAAINQAPSPAPADVAVALRAIQDWPWVTGSFAFDDQGNLVGRKVPRVIVENGEFVYLTGTGESAVAASE